MEGADYGIRANCILPGWVDTEMMRADVYTGPAREEWIKNCPLHRTADPDEVAAVIEFLLSDNTSLITGVSLPVDGGRGMV